MRFLVWPSPKNSTNFVIFGHWVFKISEIYRKLRENFYLCYKKITRFFRVFRPKITREVHGLVHWKLWKRKVSRTKIKRYTKSKSECVSKIYLMVSVNVLSFFFNMISSLVLHIQFWYIKVCSLFGWFG